MQNTQKILCILLNTCIVAGISYAASEERNVFGIANVPQLSLTQSEEIQKDTRRTRDPMSKEEFKEFLSLDSREQQYNVLKGLMDIPLRPKRFPDINIQESFTPYE